ncbi:MAG TPA: DUF4384 domain-containing protein [Gemmatimonadales bacterium]|jgi:hypothetical protein
MTLLFAPLLAQNPQTPITVRLNHDQFTAGDRARVYVETAQDGYLVVLHADAEGRVRVLFPIDPRDDDFVRGGKRFEVRGRSDRDAFQVEGYDGSGTVLAAVSPDAFTFNDFVRNDHWDFRALGGPSTSVKDDPLARLLEIAQRMSGDSSGRFDYDAATYVVTSRAIASRYGYDYGYGLYPYRLGYYDPFCSDPFFFGWSASCSGFGYGFGYRGGFGFGFGFPIYRPYIPVRPYVFNALPGPRFAGRSTPRLLIPSRPNRYLPTQVRPRETARPDVAPRWNGPRSSRGQPNVSSGGRPSVSRGFGGLSRPAARPSSGGSRGGGGGRRH